MYSQHGEDEIVAGIFGEGFVGRLLEIGAWDPSALSNSRMFIEAGWKAVLVEFSPKPVRALVEAHAGNENVMILQAAVTPCDGGLARFEVSDDGLSSNDPASLEKWRADAGYFGALWVPQLPVENLLLQFGNDFDFISVDTEGSSVEVALALLHQGCRPRAMCVEHDDRLVELMACAQKLGYSVRWMNGTNAIINR